MKNFKSIVQPIRSFIDLLYPQLCFACGKHPKPKETSICIHCYCNITPTNYHLMPKNPVLERFWGRVELEHASSSFAFSKGGLLQHLIHQLKYESKPEIGIELGKMYGVLLKDTPPYNTVDYIIPVPLHPKKEHLRGYNQAAMFAKGLAASMEKKWSEAYLVRVENTATQTKKSRLDRFAKVEHAFGVALEGEIKGKHLLLVDDVITTGATLEACAHKLLTVRGVKVSLAAIALAG